MVCSIAKLATSALLCLLVVCRVRVTYLTNTCIHAYSSVSPTLLVLRHHGMQEEAQ